MAPGASFAGITEDFNLGKNHFQKGNYEKAIQYFKKAQQSGLTNAALYYNLGVSHFKLAQYKQASYYFKKTRSFKGMRALAEYNLGLVALKQNKPRIAASWFSSAAKLDNKKISMLAEKQLKKLYTKSVKKWYSNASISVGHNNNITAANETASEQTDNYFELYVMTDGTLSGTYYDGIRLKASFRRMDYAKVNTYDDTLFNLGIYKNAQLAKWKTSIGAYYDRSTFNDMDYLRTIGLEASGKYPLNKRDTLYLRYRYNDIDSLSNSYNYLQGSRQKFQIALWQYTKNHSATLSYELELNDREDTATRSFSPTRHIFYGSYRFPIYSNWKLGFQAGYRYSDYPIKPTQAREDDRYRTAILLSNKIDKNWKIKAKYQRTDNNSTDINYDYTQNLYYISANYSF